MEKIIKQIIDIVFAVVLIIVLFPLLIIVAILLYIFQKKQIFFSQPRVGLNEKVFHIYKFKTMMDLYDESGELLPDELRVTKLGQLLRSYSLDELPQIFNIIMGELSFIGPRPLLVEYLDLYSSEQKRRHTVKPGITGLAQVNGRNSICWEDKFKLDVEYVDHWSLYLDLKIFLKTFKVIFFKKNVSTEDNKFMPKFNGKN